MQTAHHTAVLAGYFLAPPAPSPTATSLSAQFHYAMSSWTGGALIVLVIACLIFAALVSAVLRVVGRAGGSRQQ